MVATKTALSCRIDALSDADTKSAEDAPIQGIENRSKLESRLRALEQGMGITNIRRQTAGAAMNKQPGKFEMRTNGAAQYNNGADALIPSQTTPAAPSTNGVNGTNGMEVDGDEIADLSIKTKKDKKDKKRKRDAAQEFADEAADVSLAAPAETADEADKKEKKKRKKEAKLAEKAGALERVAAAEIGDVSLATTLAGDTTKADESMLDDDEKKRLKAEKKAAKKAKKAAAA
jgi:nucleolar protein 58